MMGWTDAPLIELGRQNAVSTSNKLAGIKNDRITSSDLGRAFATAYIIARELGYADAIETSRGLREVNYGDLGNRPYDVLPRLSAEEFADFAPPNGESLKQMQQRVVACVDLLGKNYSGKSVLLVAHDRTINAIKASFKQNNIGVESAIHHAHDFVAKFTWASGHIKSFKEINRLPDTISA